MNSRGTDAIELCILAVRLPLAEKARAELAALKDGGGSSAMDEATEARWQKRIYDRIREIIPDVDGSGCESGDALDVTMAEIGALICHFEDRIDALTTTVPQVVQQPFVTTDPIGELRYDGPPGQPLKLNKAAAPQVASVVIAQGTGAPAGTVSPSHSGPVEQGDYVYRTPPLPSSQVPICRNCHERMEDCNCDGQSI